ncbi:hypothetical protein JQK62_20260, partial [Leptospira santarosai]|nr:hypothetical protein [Leptospira santarosai]
MVCMEWREFCVRNFVTKYFILNFSSSLFVIFFDNRRHFYNTAFLIAFSAISMILCMVFPIHLEIGFIFDLRYIPFIIVALYGGYLKLLPLYIVLNVYRFMIGGEGTIQSLLFSTAIFIIVPLISKKFLRVNTQKRNTHWCFRGDIYNGSIFDDAQHVFD